jgi:hypothetical protein
MWGRTTHKYITIFCLRGEFKRGEAPLLKIIPLPLNEGEGDKGDRVTLLLRK